MQSSLKLNSKMLFAGEKSDSKNVETDFYFFFPLGIDNGD